MTIAGIDWGSTLIKAYWRKDGRPRYATADGIGFMPGLTRTLHEEGVRRVRVTGIGSGTYAGHLEEGFEVIGPAEGAVDDEIRLQAAGTRLLLELRGHAPRKLLVASVGTGVSYAVAKGRAVKRSPLGSAHGGGTLMGLGRLAGARDFGDLEDAAARGTPCDLLVKHQVPATDGTPLGELVIAHFWKDGASFQDRCASVFSFAACSIAKDLAVLTSIPFSPKDVAVVGKVASSRVFRRALERWTPFLKGRRLHFPEHGEYAAAVGAWAALST